MAHAFDAFLPRSAAIHPDRTAIVHGERRISYREFDARTRRRLVPTGDLAVEHPDGYIEIKDLKDIIISDGDSGAGREHGFDSRLRRAGEAPSSPTGMPRL